MPNWLLYSLAVLGCLSVFVFLAPILKEIFRSARQGVRLAHVYARLSGRRNPKLHWYWKCFKGEILGSYYDSVTIGPYKLDRDPSKPIRISH